MKTLAYIVCWILPLSFYAQQEDLVRMAASYLEKSQNSKSILHTMDFEVSSQHVDPRTGMFHVYFQQQVDQIDIFNAISSVTLSFDGRLVHLGNRTFNTEGLTIDHEVWKTDIMPFIGITASHLKHPYQHDAIAMKSQNPDVQIIRSASLSSEPIHVGKVLTPWKGRLIPSWEIQVFTREKQEMWLVRIDAQTQQIINDNSWTSSCFFEGPITTRESHIHRGHNHNHMSLASESYQVLAYPLMNPDDGARTSEIAPWTDNPSASPFGWHDLNGIAGAEHTITRGNNVYAYEDRDGNNVPGFAPDGGASLCFEFPMDLGQTPVNYQGAAITNLFYWNNFVHDVIYNYGFTESAGNFQENNYGKGGSGSDGINAEAQDGSGLNNANFLTPPDGSNGRMQMFEWTPGSNIALNITQPAGLVQSFQASPSTFAPDTGKYVGKIVYGIPNLGCVTTLSNAAEINGHIALIDRGSCRFVRKTLAAQNAGAIGAIIVNNTPGGTLTMGGDTSVPITIPVIMISMTDGQKIKDTLLVKDVFGEINFGEPLINRDSDLDNGIIIHEYAHGISNRLTGGGSNVSCLNNQEQMGEGWSDWYATVMTIQSGDQGEDKVGVGTYVLGQDLSGDGIRPTSYSTDMNINPSTYGDIASLSVPHGVGYVWATMLWDMTWLLIEEYGFDPDLYSGTGGNNIALHLVTTALKLQPCSPGFVDGRDAILAADSALYGATNSCLIWEAFSRRGLGFSADQNSTNSRADGIEAFDMPLHCFDTISLSKSAPVFAHIGDTIPFEICIQNYELDLTNAKLVDPISEEFSFAFSSNQSGTFSQDSFFINYGNIDSATTIKDTVWLIATGDTNSILRFHDPVDNQFHQWSLFTINGSAPWTTSDSLPKSGQISYFIPNFPSTNTHILTSPAISLGPSSFLGFDHFFDLEDSWDGGFVEISTDGSLWIDARQFFVQNGYTDRLRNGSNPFIANKFAFTGDSNGYIRSWLDLRSFANQTIFVRFFFGSDQSVAQTGWYIDDIVVYDVFGANNKACLENEQGLTVCDSTAVMILPPCDPCYQCDGITLTVSTIDKQVFSASQTLNANALIDTSQHVLFNAGSSILLNDLFEVKKGGTFQADIENCNN